MIIIISLIFIVAVLLVAVVLIQNSKGGGIASNVGISQQVMGVQRSTENVEKMTWILVSTLAVLCVVSGFVFNTKTMNASNTQGNMDPKIQFTVPESPVTQPGTPGTQQAPPATNNPAPTNP